MSSEVCPFCGKSYKRLKSHLPHCKAAVKSRTPSSQQDVAANPTTPSPQLTVGLLEKTPQTKKSKKVSEVSSGQSQLISSESANVSASSSLTPTSIPPSTKKKKQKLPGHTKTTVTSSTVASSESLPPSPSSALSKPKKQSLRALVEAAKSIQVAAMPPGETCSSSQISPLNSRIASNPDKDTKPKQSDIKKKSRETVNDSWEEENKRESEDLSANEMLWKLKRSSSHQARITLQDAKTMLGRGKSSRKGILGQTDRGTSPSPIPVQTGNQKVDLSCFGTTKPLLSNLQPSTSLQHESLTPAERKKCQQATLIPQLRHDGSLQSATPLLTERLSPQVSQAPPLPGTASLNEGLKAGLRVTSLTPFPSVFHPFVPPAALTLPVKVETREKLQLEAARENPAGDRTKGDLNQRSVGQVRLRELPDWLASRTPTRPGDVVEIMQRGWQWYYGKYINVKKGGIGGLAMLLTGYCVLSYIWSYPRLKRDRWRKYH